MIDRHGSSEEWVGTMWEQCGNNVGMYAGPE